MVHGVRSNNCSVLRPWPGCVLDAFHRLIKLPQHFHEVVLFGIGPFTHHAAQPCLIGFTRATERGEPFCSGRDPASHLSGSSGGIANMAMTQEHAYLPVDG